MRIVILHDVRSIHNVGAILRTADGFGVKQVYLTGYTPYPKQTNDTRLPHIAERVERQLHKTALGAERSVLAAPADIHALIKRLKTDGYTIIAIEQAANALTIGSYQPAGPLALIFGNEVDGLSPEILQQCDQILEIPMHGTKNSFNVSAAAAIALYALSDR